MYSALQEYSMLSSTLWKVLQKPIVIQLVNTLPVMDPKILIMFRIACNWMLSWAITHLLPLFKIHFNVNLSNAMSWIRMCSQRPSDLVHEVYNIYTGLLHIMNSLHLSFHNFHMPIYNKRTIIIYTVCVIDMQQQLWILSHVWCGQK